MKLAIFNTHTPHESFACELISPGCTLGRGPDNTIILADQLARISLIQAIIKIQDDHVRISNMGQQLIYINGESLAFTKEISLQHDDQIRIAHYLILCDFAADSALRIGTHVDTWAGVGLGMTGTASIAQHTSNDSLVQHAARPTIAPEPRNLEQRPPLTVMPMSIDDNYHMATSSTLAAQSHLAHTQAPEQTEVLAQTQAPDQIEVQTQTQASESTQAYEQTEAHAQTQVHKQGIDKSQTPDITANFVQDLPPTEEVPSQVAEEFDDPFSDFLSGPGVVPIGGEVDLHQINPFEMESRSSRISSDPLKQLEAQGIQDASIQGEILSVFRQDGTEQHKHTIFTDSTPTTVKQNNVATEQQEEDLLDILHTLSFEEAMRHQ